MARYIVTSGSKFEPFSYEELAAPIQQFTDAQNAAAEKYDELNVQTQALANYIDRVNDPHAWEMYNNYMTQLQTLQENLWNKGYNAGTVRDLTNARGLYARDMNRISKAIEARQERAADWSKRVTDDPSLFTSYNPATASLDKYIENDNYGMDWRSYSGNALAEEGNAIGKSLAQRIYNNEGWYRTILGDQYYDQILNYGIHPRDINNATEKYIAGQKTSDNPMEQLIMDAIDQIYNASGMPEWADDPTRIQAIRRIREGLSSAEGVTKVDVLPVPKPSTDGGGGSGSGSGDIDITKDYVLQPTIQEDQNEAGAKTHTDNEANFGVLPGVVENPDGTMSNPRIVIVRNEDGTTSPKEVYTKEQMTELIYHPYYVDDIINKYKIDPRWRRGWTDQTRQNVRLTFENDKGETKLVDYMTGVLTHDQAKKLGMTNIPDEPMKVMKYDEDTRKWIIDKQITLEVNDARYRYQQNIENIKKDNADIGGIAALWNKESRMKEIALTPAEEYRMKKGREAENVGWRDLVYTTEPGALHSRSDSIDIVGGTSDQDFLRENYLGLIEKTYYDNKPQSGQSRYAFYPINEDGSISSKGETNIKKVYPTDTNGNTTMSKRATLSIRPHEMEQGMVRLTIPETGKTWAVYLDMLGSNFYSEFNNPVPIQLTNGKNVDISLREAINIAMMPLYKPSEILNNWTASDIYNNTEIVQALLGRLYPLRPGVAGYMKDRTPLRNPYTLEEIVRDPKLKMQLRQALGAIIPEAIAHPNDIMRNFKMRVPGNAAEMTHSR